MVFNKGRTKRGLSFVRIISAVLVLGILVLFVAESAKYLNEARVPKSISSKLETSLATFASVTLSVRNIKDSLVALGSGFGGEWGDRESGSLAMVDKINSDDFDKKANESGNPGVTTQGPDVAGVASSRSQDGLDAFEGSPARIATVVAVISDAHNDLENLTRALNKAKDLGADRVVFLGDYTDYGELARLYDAKKIMDASGLPYFSLPGDHDLAETRDESNFVKDFDRTYGTYKLGDIKFMYFDNSKNYTKISESVLAWFDKEIQDTHFLFLSQPLVTDNMSRVMGIINGVKDVGVFSQNERLLRSIRNSEVRVIMSGDLHKFSQFKDPVKEDLWHYSVGAVFKTQSLDKFNIQAPRFALLSVKEDLSYKVLDIPID